MCGIVGRINIDKDKKITVKQISNMLEAINHRGPDDGGYKIFGNVAIGNRRLAIIDLSKKGHQPMKNTDGNLWIVYNGEIYNFPEVRLELIKNGYKFKSNSDTEVILAAYQFYGVECLKMLRGMFAFVIYDLKKGEIFAARDRLGEKPFKYYFDGEIFAFSSEIKAFFTQPDIAKKVDETAIPEYLYWGFVPAPKTGYKNIFKLPAANYLIFKNGKITIKKYWDYKDDINYQRSEKDTISELRKLISESVKLRMVSDVPVGAFLSGGIDSCIVVGLMSKLSKQKVETFTIGFKNWKNDESADAKIISKFHKTNHHTFIINPNIAKLLPKIVQAYDEPFGDGSAVPSYCISQIASKKLKVVLTGDGGDENFLGYGNYELFMNTQKFAFLSPMLLIANPIIRPFTKILNKNFFYLRGLRAVDILKDNNIDNYAKYSRGYLNLIKFEDLFNNFKTNPATEFRKYFKNAKPDIESIVHQDFQNILPDGLMTKMDIASMQWSLEARSPLLDHKLVEFCATIPPSLKIKNKQTKYIFRKAFKDLIPKRIYKLPKRGFVMPVDEWFRNELKSLLEEGLSDKTHPLYKIISYSTVQEMVKLHQQKNLDFSFMLWRLLLLMEWYNHYFRDSLYYQADKS